MILELMNTPAIAGIALAIPLFWLITKIVTAITTRPVADARQNRGRLMIPEEAKSAWAATWSRGKFASITLSHPALGDPKHQRVHLNISILCN